MLQISKKQKCFIWIIINVIISLLGIKGIFELNNNIETNISQDSLELSRSNIVVENGFYVDDSFEGEEKYITTPSILLDRGIYKVIINYDTKYGMSSVKAEIPGGGYNTLFSDTVILEKDSNEISFNIYVNKNRQNVKIKCYFFENIDDYVLIRDVRIIPFRMNKLYEVLKLLFVLFVVNLLCIFSLKYKLISAC